eukprot:m.45180 g.45180  ORF g.45180 m.45180 type:complete len:481 (+) comp15119_c0_seq3:453-1895(+)
MPPGDMWSCAACTFINPSQRTVCETCLTPNLSASVVGTGTGTATAAASDLRAWECKVCTLVNSSVINNCGACGTPRVKQQYWLCQSCTMQNSGFAIACTACGMPRPDPDTQFNNPIVTRHLSQSDEALAARIHEGVRCHTVPIIDGKPVMIVTSFFTTVIPATMLRSKRGGERFFSYCQQELGDMHAKSRLEGSGVLNWVPVVDRTLSSIHLLPLCTTGDGNCLLHAASVAMFGVHDEALHLRQQLAQTLCADAAIPLTSAYYPRWHADLIASQLKMPADFRVIRDFEAEWKTVVDLPQLTADDSVAGRRVGIFGASLQGIHVYVLAQVLRRPIIVYGYADLDTRESDTSLTGIFLPSQHKDHLEMCWRHPLTLGAMQGHFSAIAPYDTTTHVPLCDSNGRMLPIRFESTSPREEPSADLLHRFMDVTDTLPGVVLAAACQSVTTLTDEDRTKMTQHNRALWDAYIEQASARFVVATAED